MRRRMAETTAVTVLYPFGRTAPVTQELSSVVWHMLAALETVSVVSPGLALNLEIATELPTSLQALFRKTTTADLAHIYVQPQNLAKGVSGLVYSATEEEWNDEDNITRNELAVPLLDIVVFNTPVELQSTQPAVAAWAFIIFAYENRPLQSSKYGVRDDKHPLFRELRLETYADWNSVVVPIAA